MGVEVCSGQVECRVSAKRMWLAAFQEAHDAVPKAMPRAISHISYEGPRGNPMIPGLTTRITHFHRSFAETRAKERQLESVELLVKEKLLEMDAELLKLKMEEVEGGIVSSFVKSAKESMHIMEGTDPNASCTVHWSFEYEPHPGKDQTQVPLILNKLFSHFYKSLEEHLVSHNDYLQSC
ncbi:hypothetical protein L7F22_013738 [Adiantum nelumboides]|nr:hypothetical protein [Adiantum nelumboides]